MRLKRLFDFPIRSLSSNHGANTLMDFERIPGPKPLPVLGNVWRYLPLIGDYDIGNLFGNARTNKAKYGPIVREQITRNHVILHLFDPNDIEAFFRQDSNEPYRRSHRALLKLRHDNPNRYNDGGIFPENGSSWTRLRSLFHRSLMKTATIAQRGRILNDITMHTINSIDGKQSNTLPNVRMDNFEKFLYRWSVRCGLAVFLDYTNSNMPKESVLDKIIACSDDQLEALAETEIKSDKWIKNPSKCPYYQKLLQEEDFMYGFVEERVDHLLRTGSMNAISFVRDWLINDGLDRKDVITFITDCVTANIHTTVYTCMFLLENISRRMEVNLKNQLLAEIRAAQTFAEDEHIIWDISEKTPILKDCLKETLRLHPVSIGTGRLTQYDMSIGNYRIPKDTMVIAHNQTISLDPSIYVNPNQFQPNRWARYRSLPRLERPSPFAWLPFGFGPRACIGQRLVSQQIQILTMKLLQRYDVKFLGEIKTRTTLVHQLDGEISVELILLPQ